MSASDPFELQLGTAWPVSAWADLTVLVAVSGGPDSVALLCGLTACRREGAGSVIAAHFNHALRGPDSDDDQAFVEDLCRRLGLQCITARASATLTGQAESSLRDARYQFLLAAAENAGARYLATAHTANDQAETILHRIFRGTGLAGLAGIPRFRRLSHAVSLVRPMLSIRREEVLAYLRRRNQPYREDASNYCRQYTRNRLRHDLLPTLQTHYNEEVVDAILRLGQLAADAQQVIADQVDAMMERLVTRHGAEIRVDRAKLSAYRPHLTRELMIGIWQQQGWPQQAMGFEHWHQLGEMVRETDPDRVASSTTLPGSVEVRRCGEWLCLRLLET